MKTQLISTIALGSTIVVSIICFLLFFLVGYDNMVGEYNDPMLTSLLLGLMYVLIVVTTILTAWAMVKGMMESGSANTGVNGTLVSVVAWGLLIVSLVVGGIFGIGEESFIAADGTETSALWVTVTDVFLGSIYVMTLGTIVSVAYSMIKSWLN